MSPDLILASASPRRRELLAQIGCRFQVCPVDVDETPDPGENPEDYVVRLAVEKARSGAGLRTGTLPVMGADTTVVSPVDPFTPLGKPADESDAVAMLMALSGRDHEVLSAVALAAGDNVQWRLSRTRVRFRELSEAECRRYWRTGEPRDKAGAYAIQGLGAVFVEHIAGSYSGVVGLPLAETRELLDLYGIGYWQPLS